MIYVIWLIIVRKFFVIFVRLNVLVGCVEWWWEINVIWKIFYSRSLIVGFIIKIVGKFCC